MSPDNNPGLRTPPPRLDYGGDREIDPGFRAPRADYGAIDAFSHAVNEGFSSNFTGMGYRASKYWVMKRRDEADTRGINPENLPQDTWIDKETFDKEYSIKGALKFDGHFNGKMSRKYASELLNDYIDDQFLAARSARSRAPVASFAGSLVGGLLSPVDLAINLAIPEFAVAKFGLAGSVASRSGTGAARLTSRTLNGAANGAAQAIALQYPMSALSSYNQTEYGVEDILSNIAVGPIMGAGAGLLHGVARHAFGDFDRTFANAVMHAAASDKDPTMAAKVAASDPRVAQLMEHRRRVKELIEKTTRTADEDAQLSYMAGENPPENMRELMPDPASLARDGTDRILSDSGRAIDSTGHEGPLPPKKLPYQRTKKIIDDILANPEDKRIRSAFSDDERFLAEAWKTLWGVDLKFVHPELGRSLGFRGFTKPNDPSKAYIVAGALNDGSIDSMMFVAGHELGHSVRMKDAGLWQDMTAAMMKTSGEDAGALASAWSTVVAHSKGNSHWAGLDMSGKMDETFATVLGKATQTDSFWRALDASAPTSASKLAAYISGLKQKFEALFGTGVDAPTQSLHEHLAKALLAADAQGRRISERAGASPVDLADLYRNHSDEFSSMVDRLSQKFNERGLRQEVELAQFTDWYNQAMPIVGTLDDQSGTPNRPGRFSVILKNKRINSDNPGLYVLLALFKKATPGSEEFNTYSKWMQDEFSWAENDRRLDRKSKEVTDRAVKAHPRLAAFKKNQDGTWDIGIYNNDAFPKWHETLELPDNSSTDLVADLFYQQEFSEVRKAFREFAEDPTNSGKRRSIGSEFDSFTHGLGESDMHELVYFDPDEIWVRFAQHIDDRLSEYRMANDQRNWENLFDLRKEIDVLLRHDEDTGSRAAADQVHPSNKTTLEDQSEQVRIRNLKAKWDDFRKTYDKTKDALSERELSKRGNVGQNGPLPEENPTEFFARLFNETRADVASNLTEMTNGLRAFHLVKGGKGFEWSIIKAMIGEEKFDAKLNKVIDEITADRVSEFWPRVDDIDQIRKVVKDPNYQHPSLDKMLEGGFDPADPMADFRDMLSFMAGTPGDVRQEAVSRRLSVEEAGKLVLTRLDREHATYSKFLTSYEAEADAFIKDAAARNGADGFTLDLDAAKPAEGTPPPSGPLAKELEAVKGGYAFVSNQLKAHLKGKEPKGDAKMVIERLEYHKRQGLDAAAAAAATAADIRRGFQAKAVGKIREHEASTSLKARSSRGLKWLYSFLDGSARKGVKGAGENVSEAMTGRVLNDLSPFLRELNDTGLDGLWTEGNDAVVRSVIRHLKGQESTDPLIKRLAETLRKSQEVQTGRLNSLGANIRHLEGYAFSQVHNPNAIFDGGVDYISDLRDWLDWDATSRAVGANTTDSSGKPVFDQGLYLKQLQHELSKTGEVPEGFNPETMGGNLANQVSHRRTLHFKETFAYDYDMKYGSGNTSGLIMQQLVKRAELATVMEHFGPDYKKTWGGLMNDLGRARKWRFSELGRIDGTFKELVGDLNHPEDVKLAEMGRAASNYVDSVAIWMSGISSITDIGNATASLRWMGASPADLSTRLAKSMKEIAVDHKGREFLLAQGAGFDALLNSMTRTMTLNGPMYRWAQKGADIAFKYSGLELWTKTLQGAFHDLSSQHLGSMADAKMTPDFLNWLEHYGITQDEWKSMSKHATEIEGLSGRRLAADLIPDESLASKLRTAMMDTMHQAILQPSVSDRAHLTFYTKAGTPIGTAVRVLNKYKGFPLAMMRRVHRRFANAYGNESVTAFGVTVNKGRIAQLAWAGSMLSLAYTALTIKDILKGREPLNPFDTDQWTIGNVSRVVMQGGVGPFAVAEQFLSPHQAFGPLVGMGYDLGSGIATGNGYRTANATIGLLPGASIAPIRESSKAILGSIFTETYGSHYQQFLRWNEQETGQSSIFLDN